MDDRLTLRQGLERFHQLNQAHLSLNHRGISEETELFFRSHDIAHVLFGCDISLYGEGAVKVWTIFGTSMGFWKHIQAYKKAHAFTLSKRYTFNDITTYILILIVSIPLIIIRAKRMHKQWPWSGYNAYLDVPIIDIRKEFNIKILKHPYQK